MADIAMVFHWPFDAMQGWSLESLAQWHARAVKRWKLLHGKADQ